MCGLCGILGDGTHWADGIGPEQGASAVPWLRRRARRQRVALGNQVLRAYGLHLADWQGTRFLLSNRTGAAQVVGGLADLWTAADRMAGRPLDPLDPSLLDALDGRGRA